MRCEGTYACRLLLRCCTKSSLTLLPNSLRDGSCGRGACETKLFFSRRACRSYTSLYLNVNVHWCVTVSSSGRAYKTEGERANTLAVYFVKTPLPLVSCAVAWPVMASDTSDSGEESWGDTRTKLRGQEDKISARYREGREEGKEEGRESSSPNPTQKNKSHPSQNQRTTRFAQHI